MSLRALGGIAQNYCASCITANMPKIMYTSVKNRINFLCVGSQPHSYLDEAIC